MKTWILPLAASLIAAQPLVAQFKISSASGDGSLGWINAFKPGICTLESAGSPAGDWRTEQNVYTTSSMGAVQVALPAANRFYRLLALDISTNSPEAVNNLFSSYGVLRTIAGNGQFSVDGGNFWQPSYEGGPATEANLSRPHFAMADQAGNIFIVDKDSHSILKVTPDGLIHTVAGTHVGGDNGDGPAPGTSLQLNFPNGEWVRSDGTVYILDTGNSKVRKLDTDGTMTTLFTVGSGIATGRGLWVKDDESLCYFCSGTDLRKRVPGNISTLNNNFTELANIVVTASGEIIATDRGDNKVYRVDTTGSNAGSRTRIAGNGSTSAVVDGTPALLNGLYGVRGVWPLPNGGYLLATHEGSQVLYMDPAGVLYMFVDGEAGDVHAGDGQWFHAPGLNVTEVRSVTMDHQGNILITENDFGYVRKIEFSRLQP
ncbi:MAG TPA: hypothetical protein VNM37_07570 [Candidatus Dormibacteraeota bacterium]|nr:hypothetical protein [Candidatus Dormibacteraeota bacterium]